MFGQFGLKFWDFAVAVCSHWRDQLPHVFRCAPFLGAPIFGRIAGASTTTSHDHWRQRQ
jgi:hypothetical protein